MTGASFGTAGGSARKGGDWAASNGAARVGADGERRTAELLGALVNAGATVLHDLRVPISGVKANIDHVVVSGRTVLIIDSKVWAPGIYWTLGGHTRRGRESFPPADKKTIPMILPALERHLAGTRAKLATPLLIVWPSRPGPTSFLFASTPAARLVAAHRGIAAVLAQLGTVKPADDTIAIRLRQLVIRPHR